MNEKPEDKPERVPSGPISPNIPLGPAPEASSFPLPPGLTRADRRRIEGLAGMLLGDPA